MADLTVASFEEMEPIYDGIARRARATLGVSAFGMQVMTLPADWAGYPNHRHVAGVEDANQEEIYIPLEGSATLVADEQQVGLRPGMVVRVGPEQPAHRAWARWGSPCRAWRRARLVLCISVD